MRDAVYLVFRKGGVTGMKKRLPSLRQGEYAVLVTVDVPDSYFKSPIPTATINVADTHVIAPVTVAAVAKPDPVCEDCGTELSVCVINGRDGLCCDTCGWSFNTDTGV